MKLWLNLTRLRRVFVRGLTMAKFLRRAIRQVAVMDQQVA